METGIKAKDIMDTEVPAVSQTDQVARLRNIIIRRKVNKILVYDDELKGIVTEKDIAKALAEERRAIDEVRVREIMTRSLITAGPNEKPEEIAKTMIEKGISGVPIVNDDEVLGMITKKDMMNYCSKYCRGKKKVKDLMTRKVKTVKPMQSLFHAAKEMEENKISRLVVTEGNEPLGIITERDISLATQGLHPSKVTYSSTDDEGETHRRKKIYPMIVSDVMQENLKTVEAKNDAAKAGKKMVEEEIGSLIIQEKDELKGIITKTDIVKFLAQNQ